MREKVEEEGWKVVRCSSRFFVDAAPLRFSCVWTSEPLSLLDQIAHDQQYSQKTRCAMRHTKIDKKNQIFFFGLSLLPSISHSNANAN